MANIKLNENVVNEIDKISKVSGMLWEKGWAEGSGGNISVNLTEKMRVMDIDESKYRYTPVSNYPKELSKKIFFVTCSGVRIRDLNEPKETCCIIRFDESVKGYHLLWGAKDKRPTSELISHVKIHLQLEKFGKVNMTVLHSHPTELICLSHHPLLNKNEEEFNEIIWGMLPEVRVFVPKGVAILPYALPGSEKLADLTVEGLKRRDIALWSKHGALVAAKDIIEAFDLLDIANKGCYIYLKCLASGFIPEGMSREDKDELVRYFKL